MAGKKRNDGRHGPSHGSLQVRQTYNKAAGLYPEAAPLKRLILFDQENGSLVDEETMRHNLIRAHDR